MNPASSRRRDQYGTSADQTLLDQYLRLRQHTQALVARLNHEDMAVNRELGGDFDPDAFDHLALWNPVHSRMEMHLVSRKDQIVNAAGHTFAFRNGERLHTENSHKFTIDSFAQLAARGGWSVANTWISDEPRVAMFRLEPHDSNDWSERS